MIELEQSVETREERILPGRIRIDLDPTSASPSLASLRSPLSLFLITKEHATDGGQHGRRGVPAI